MATINTIKLAARIADVAYRTDFVRRDAAVKKAAGILVENIKEVASSGRELADEVCRAWQQAPGGHAPGPPVGCAVGADRRRP